MGKLSVSNLYVVVNCENEALVLDSSPWGAGECLINCGFNHFSVFESKKRANNALRLSKEYSKKENLEEFWGISEWKVIPLMKYLNSKYTKQEK